MKYIAIIGFGVVGGGITEVIEQNKAAVKRLVGDEIYVKYILDLREFPDSPYGDRVVHDVNIIADDPEISVVCETMGGVNPAFDFSMLMLKNKKSVVTSNKELVAKRGVELLSAARQAGVQYLFEASVGGGIPEIRGMRTSLAGDTVSGIDGIMNGTTNYILTRMKKDGASFDEALSEAQRLGYAEKDPTADVDGFDAQRKIMILTAVATDMMADEGDVYRETMRNITPLDMDAAARFGGTVKLLGSARIGEDSASVFVCPFFVPSDCPLSFVDDVYNGIRVMSPVTADVMFYGRGAGRMPTAGAVVADVVSVLSGIAEKERSAKWEYAPDGYITPFEENSFSYYLRIRTESPEECAEAVRLAFGGAEILQGSPEGFAELITDEINEKDARSLFPSLEGLESHIRIMK
ncbi:MAG: homoserine dehydrogenase [Clostridia bacterium]|nr:homoserine dehydrogenase [Clostridia bacterium]